MSRHDAMEMTEDTQIPKVMKLTMIFIDRVGFPTMAYLLMFYLCVVTLRQVKDAIIENTKALATLGQEIHVIAGTR